MTERSTRLVRHSRVCSSMIDDELDRSAVGGGVELEVDRPHPVRGVGGGPVGVRCWCRFACGVGVAAPAGPPRARAAGSSCGSPPSPRRGRRHRRCGTRAVGASLQPSREATPAVRRPGLSGVECSSGARRCVARCWPVTRQANRSLTGQWTFMRWCTAARRRSGLRSFPGQSPSTRPSPAPRRRAAVSAWSSPARGP